MGLPVHQRAELVVLQHQEYLLNLEVVYLQVQQALGHEVKDRLRMAIHERATTTRLIDWLIESVEDIADAD